MLRRGVKKTQGNVVKGVFLWSTSAAYIRKAGNPKTDNEISIHNTNSFDIRTIVVAINGELCKDNRETKKQRKVDDEGLNRQDVCWFGESVL